MPVLAPLGLGPEGELLNINADLVEGDVAHHRGYDRGEPSVAEGVLLSSRGHVFQERAF